MAIYWLFEIGSSLKGLSLYTMLICLFVMFIAPRSNICDFNIFQENEVLDKENHNITEQLSKSEETKMQLQKELESLAGLQQRVCISSV
jgi:hypothetical protein